METKNIFVVGLEDANLRTLRRVPGAEHYRYHPLLTVSEIQEGEIPIAELMDKAVAELDRFDGRIDAIVGYWDFPVTSLVPILCDRYGLPSPNLDGVIRCEHKYWSRLEQQKVTDAHPKFALVDLDGDDRPPRGMNFPMWLKPVKSFSSELAFKAKDERGFAEAVEKIREGIERVGKPFQWVLDHARDLEMPREIAETGALACLAEEAMQGVQAASEGYVHNGHIVVNGVLDSINYPDSSSFLRHQYPSQLPREAVEKIVDVSERVIKGTGLDNSMFSVEFFVVPESADVCVLEINARHSQSHAEMFEFVDGVPNHHCMVELGLGNEPNMPRGQGEYRFGAKWYYRRFADGIVRRLPTEEELEQLARDIPGVEVDLVPAEGQRLSDMDAQDSYSYELAFVYTGGDSEDEVKEKYQRAIDSLRFEFEEV
ncbi:ATP-grasp domain-containing protein [Amycolatopsis sp. K13G38]|uniref:ATP-grasp domain-containing protein n=1 Tax=Amycolatopsis acididurans TaxID=2724524 RepID=A0ABX1IZU2_9PSEU|nr:ATP-grasp domain-containing protein [Amycolatopsis acididurans]NKQ53033.1 ATP-grasp domain-containing protein [Amycolatopsis acididurans]